ncbi:MAG: DUF937 domain-containing protein [Beijerinckiaceae bacterium]
MPLNSLFEMIQNAQGGNALDNLARQYQLSQEQAQSAVNAVLPAFQMGLQRQAESADMMANFLRTLASSNAGEVFEKPQAMGTVSDQFQAMGHDILQMLFGNRNVSNAVAAQAAQFSGVPNTIMNAMMPTIATMIMGGLMKGMSSQGYGNWLTQMASGMIPGMQQPAPQALPDILTQMMSMGQPKPQSGMFGTMGAMMDSMMGAKPPASDSGNPMQAGLDALTGMFNAGAKVQQTHMEGMASIFNTMLKSGRNG